MNNQHYVAPVLLQNGEAWFFRLEGDKWVPHRRITYLIEGEVVEKQNDFIGDTVVS